MESNETRTTVYKLVVSAHWIITKRSERKGMKPGIMKTGNIIW